MQGLGFRVRGLGSQKALNPRTLSPKNKVKYYHEEDAERALMKLTG